MSQELIDSGKPYIRLHVVNDEGGRAEVLFATDVSDDIPTMLWDRDPKAEWTLESGTIELKVGDRVLDTVEIDGSDWQSIDEGNELGYVWFWVSRGESLGSAVSAAIENCDPDGRNVEYEHEVDEYRELLAEAESFISGFEGDTLQTGINGEDGLLCRIRRQLAVRRFAHHYWAALGEGA